MDPHDADVRAKLAGVFTPLESSGESLLELGVDALIKSDAAKELPFVSTVRGLFAAGSAVKDYLLQRKIIEFASAFHAGQHTADHVRAFLARYNSDGAYQQQVALHLVEMLDRYASGIKPLVFGALFDAFVAQRITWPELVSLSNLVDVIPRDGLAFLAEVPFASNGALDVDESDDRAALISLVISPADIGGFVPTRSGIALITHGLRPVAPHLR